MANCRSCGAEIRWAKTTSGKPIPLDPDPVPNGNLAFRDDGSVYSIPLTGDGWIDTGTPRFVTHFATCPDADEHRKPRIPE